MLLLIAAVGNVQAQHNFFSANNYSEPRTFFVGPTIGCNISQVDGDTYSGYHKVGLNLGVVSFARFSDHLGASISFTYSQKGASYKNYTQDQFGVGYLDEYSLKLNYIEIPVLLHYFSNNKLNYGAGLSYARLLNSNEIQNLQNGYYLDQSLYPFRKNDIDVLAEVNYEFYQGWFIGACYQYSITSIRSPNDIPFYAYNVRPARQFNNLFNFKLVYLIHSKK